MTHKDQIIDRPEVLKVATDFHDLGMWGEYYGFILYLSNGRQFTIRVQEHQFEQFVGATKMQPIEMTEKEEREHFAFMDNLPDSEEMTRATE